MKVIQTRAMVRAFNRREEEGFIYMFHSCYYGLYLFAMRLLKDKKKVEAAVEKTFITVWKNPGKWKSARAIKVDLYRVLQKLCIAHLKRCGKYNSNMRERRFIDELIRAEVLHNIKCTLDYLPQELHDLFKLRFVLKEEIDEVGNKLKMSRTKVRAGEARICQLIKANNKR